MGECEAAIAWNFNEGQTQPFSLAHLPLTASLGTNAPAPGQLRLPLWPCHLPAQLPRAAALPGAAGAGERSCHSSFASFLVSHPVPVSVTVAVASHQSGAAGVNPWDSNEPLPKSAWIFFFFGCC